MLNEMGAVGQTISILFTKQIRREWGQRNTPIFTITFFRTLATYSYLVIGLCPPFKFTSKCVIILAWSNKNSLKQQDV